MDVHFNHLTQWKRQGKEYRLYCFSCGAFLSQTTKEPNSQRMQPYQTATADPSKIAVTLEVQGMQHKRRTTWR